ncbi:hypothetical protein HNO92_003704 [Chromobacterium alkanivorans]|nr:hypothetical protein [Chromobacterium alkanivorans]MCS3820603.1 hypothetical protein [Chromobacterium alkanivorans]MCS3875361.1 hypothetical protein [Chromobacterium alkanivorans]
MEWPLVPWWIGGFFYFMQFFCAGLKWRLFFLPLRTVPGLTVMWIGSVRCEG